MEMSPGTYLLRITVTLPLLSTSDSLNSTWFLSYSSDSSVFFIYQLSSFENNANFIYLIYAIGTTVILVAIFFVFYFFKSNFNSIVAPQNFIAAISISNEYQPTSSFEFESAFKISDEEEILIDDFAPINTNKISESDLDNNDGI